MPQLDTKPKVRWGGVDNIINHIIIKQIREEHCITTEAMAAHLGMTEENYKRIERGEGHTRTSVISVIAEVLQVPPYLLFKQAPMYEAPLHMAPVADKKQIDLLKALVGTNEAQLVMGSLTIPIPEGALEDVLVTIAIQKEKAGE